jgi:hypothetical protein
VFVIWLDGDHLELTGPCGAAPWMIHNMSGTPEQVLANAERVVVSETHQGPSVGG